MRQKKGLGARLMPMLTIDNTSFGKINKFNVGDIVSWSNIGEKMTGVVSDIYFSVVGGRDVAFAKIYGFKDKIEHTIICLNLKLVSKNNSKTQEN